MTEAEWLSCSCPLRMLIYLTNTPAGTEVMGRVQGKPLASDRKLRLFIEAVAVQCPTCLRIASAWDDTLASLALYVAGSDCLGRDVKASLLRDIFGNPWRKYAWTAMHDCSPSGHELQFLGQRWLSWKDRLIPRLAQVIYDERAFDRMPILADALEEAGCTNQDIWMHCRGWERCPWADPHSAVDHGGKSWKEMACRCLGMNWVKKDTPCVPGCWVIDLLLGRE